MAAPATATVQGGWWNSLGVGQLVSISGANNARRSALQGFGARGSWGPLARRQMFNLMTGAANAGTIQVIYPQIAPSVELGGVRKVLTGGEALIVNRPTTAADAAEFGEWLTRMSSMTSQPSPPNGDRNPLGTR
jgi:hypothetical protein